MVPSGNLVSVESQSSSCADLPSFEELLKSTPIPNCAIPQSSATSPAAHLVPSSDSAQPNSVCSSVGYDLGRCLTPGQVVERSGEMAHGRSGSNLGLISQPESKEKGTKAASKRYREKHNNEVDQMTRQIKYYKAKTDDALNFVSAIANGAIPHDQMRQALLNKAHQLNHDYQQFCEERPH